LLSNLPQGQYGGQSGGGPLQQAVQLLNLHRPTVYGAQAPAPSALLNAAGGSGLDLNALLQALVRGRNPLGPMARPGDPALQAPTAPTPRVQFPQLRPPVNIQSPPAMATPPQDPSLGGSPQAFAPPPPDPMVGPGRF
jgi:hypothetical protein